MLLARGEELANSDAVRLLLVRDSSPPGADVDREDC